MKECYMDDKTKLKHLLSHWREHNAEHAETYGKWASRLEEMGLHGAAEELRAAITLTERTSEVFGKVDRLIH